MSINKELIPVNEINDLTVKVDQLIDKSNVFMQISTRGADVNSTEVAEFKVFDNVKLTKLAENMPEINRATNVFGRQNSQATGKLMSLNMISQSPYRRLKQCLAKIERKRGALKESIFKLRKERVKLDRLLHRRGIVQAKLDGTLNYENEPIELEFSLVDIGIEIEEIAANVSDTNLYIEGSLKEIGMYQDAYAEIKESYNIPDDWDEEDFEKCEVEEHVKTAFLHLIRDLEMTGRCNVGTSEYLEQYGVNPHIAVKLVKEYLQQTEQMINNGNYPKITMLYDFLDKMHDMFKEEYLHAMARIGLKKLVSEDYLFLDNKTEETINTEDEQF